MKTLDSMMADYLEIKRLQRNASKAYSDTYADAQRRLRLYEKYLFLRKSYRVKFAGRLLVIDGGIKQKSPRASGILIY